MTAIPLGWSLGRQSRKNEEGLGFGPCEGLDVAGVEAEQVDDGRGGGVADPEPEGLRRGTVEEGELAEVGVLGSDHEVVLGGEVPDLSVGCRVKTEGADVGAVGELGRKVSDQAA